MSYSVSDSRRAPKKAREKNTRLTARVNDLKAFLDTLTVGVRASVHINGHSFSTALVCVDFGSPLVQARLSPEETHDLNDLLRAVAREVINGREVNIRINHDGPNGVYWASIA